MTEHTESTIKLIEFADLGEIKVLSVFLELGIEGREGLKIWQIVSRSTSSCSQPSTLMHLLAIQYVKFDAVRTMLEWYRTLTRS